MKKLLAVMSAAFATILLALPASAQVVSNTSTPFSFSNLDRCTSEVVTFTGIQHEVIQLTIDGSGGMHLGDEFDEVGTGVALISGNTYVLNGGDWFQAYFPATTPFPRAITETLDIHGISQGPLPNLIAHIVIHITVNVNGTVSSTVAVFDIDCQG